MDNTDNKANIERFEKILRNAIGDREGFDKLLAFIRSSDFYTAPASTKFHSCHEGGLLEHTLNVYDCLMDKLDSGVWEDSLKDSFNYYNNATVASLLHDLCKANFYIVEWKNKKVYSDHGKKSDAVGRFDWETVPGYTVEDTEPYGHGEKSVMLIERFIELLPVERYAIRWHMGFTEPKELWNTLGLAIRKYPLILALHQADLEATYLVEKEE